MKELDLRNINFAGATAVETFNDGTNGSWEVLNGGVNPESIGFHLTRNHGVAGKTVVFYDGFWSRLVKEEGRTVIFFRLQNNGKSVDFPDQPWTEVEKFAVTWKE